MKKTILIPAAAVAITIATIVGASAVNAQTPSQTKQAIVQKLSQRFGLKEADVQAVFDEDHIQHQQQMQAHLEDKLSQAVKDGKITEAQKQAILTKLTQLRSNKQANRQNFKNMTPEQRKAAMEKERADLQTWAQSQGINLQNLPGIFGHGKGLGMRMWH